MHLDLGRFRAGSVYMYRKRRTKTLGYVLELLFEWKLVKLTSNCELPINILLRDAEVLYIKEAFLAKRLQQESSQLLLSTWCVISREIERDQISPRKCLLGLRDI